MTEHNALIRKALGNIAWGNLLILLDVNQTAKEIGSPRVANIVLLGATVPFLGISYDKVQASIRDIFQRKGESIVEMNLNALEAGKAIAEKMI